MRTLLLLVLLAGVAMAQHSVTLNWAWSQGTGDPATGFHVQRGAAHLGPYSVVATTATGTTNYIDSAVTAGSSYYYVVTAFNSTGDSLPSPEVSCAIPFQTPGAPSNLSGTSK